MPPGRAVERHNDHLDTAEDDDGESDEVAAAGAAGIARPTPKTDAPVGAPAFEAERVELVAQAASGWRSG